MRKLLTNLWGLVAAIATGIILADVITGGTIIEGAEPRPLLGSGTPVSGTSGTGVGTPPGGKYVDEDTGNEFVNEGTAASPYWTPTSYTQPNLIGVYHDFRDEGDVKAIADTAAVAMLRSGLRVFGQGIEQTDSGLTHSYEAEKGGLGALIATDEAAHLAALGMGDPVLLAQPDVHGTLVIDVEFTNESAITDRALFCGFIGAIADALDPVATGAATTITLVLDDLAGMLMDSGLTDADGIFLPHNKSDAAADIATTASGVDLSSTMPAAGTFTRWRVEVTSAGVVRAFINKAQVGEIEDALDVDEEVMPVFYVESNASATKQVNVRRIGMHWARA